MFLPDWPNPSAALSIATLAMPTFFMWARMPEIEIRSVGGVLNTQGVTGLVIASAPPCMSVGTLSSLARSFTASDSPELEGPNTTCTSSEVARRRNCWAALPVLPSVS
jgi:hypothetical protein